MSWTIENSLPDCNKHSRYQITIYNGKGRIIRTMHTEVVECINILENEAKSYISFHKKYTQKDDGNYEIKIEMEDRNNQSL